MGTLHKFLLFICTVIINQLIVIPNLKLINSLRPDQITYLDYKNKNIMHLLRKEHFSVPKKVPMIQCFQNLKDQKKVESLIVQLRLREVPKLNKITN